ncbi:MAG: LapA family protein [Geminicoccaceae bacterium]
MISLFKLIIAAVAAVVLIVFAVLNRQPVDVTLWPGLETMELPIYGVALMAMFLGSLIGAAIAWLGASGARYQAWKLQRREAARERQQRVQEIQREEEAAARAQQPKDTIQTPTGTSLALPSR